MSTRIYKVVAAISGKTLTLSHETISRLLTTQDTPLHISATQVDPAYCRAFPTVNALWDYSLLVYEPASAIISARKLAKMLYTNKL